MIAAMTRSPALLSLALVLFGCGAPVASNPLSDAGADLYGQWSMTVGSGPTRATYSLAFASDSRVRATVTMVDCTDTEFASATVSVLLTPSSRPGMLTASVGGCSIPTARCARPCPFLDRVPFENGAQHSIEVTQETLTITPFGQSAFVFRRTR